MRQNFRNKQVIVRRRGRQHSVATLLKNTWRHTRQEKKKVLGDPYKCRRECAGENIAWESPQTAKRKHENTQLGTMRYRSISDSECQRIPGGFAAPDSRAEVHLRSAPRPPTSRLSLYQSTNGSAEAGTAGGCSAESGMFS